MWSLLRSIQVPQTHGDAAPADVARCGLGSLCAAPTSCHPAGMEDFLSHSEGEFPALMQHRAGENPAQDIIIVNIFQSLRRCLKMPGRGRSRG